jgi:hypothetical protein
MADSASTDAPRGALSLGPDPHTAGEQLAILPDGRRVVLLPLPEGAVQTVRSALLRVAGVGHEHLAEPGLISHDERWVVLPAGERGSVAGRPSLGEDGRWGELVTVFLPVARALAAAHEAGVPHGMLTPARVLLSADGRPSLSGLGLAGALDAPPGTGDSTGEVMRRDVRDLAAMVLQRLGPIPQPEPVEVEWLRAAAGHGTGGDEGISMPDLEAMIRELAVPTPVRDEPGSGGRAERARRIQAFLQPASRGGSRRANRPSSTSRRARHRRNAAIASAWARAGRTRVLLGSGVAAASLLGAGALVWSATGDRAPIANGGSLPQCASPGRASAVHEELQQGSAPRWARVVQQLHDRRSFALQTRDAAALCEVYLADSPGLSADARLVNDLIRRSAEVAGLSFTVHSAHELRWDGSRAELRVHDSTTTYHVRSDGVTRQHDGVPGSTWDAVVVRTVDGWRFG